MTLFSSSGLRFKVLLPVGLGLALICIAGFLAVFILLQDHLADMIDEKLSSTEKLFTEMLDIEADNLEGLAEAFRANESFKTAFLADDRDLLFHQSTDTFNRLRNRYRITHFYFHRPDGSCFLRVHNPSRHSDRIRRYTLKQAKLTGIPSRGYELGPLGTLTLRVVVPWPINGRIVGYIELGKEIDTLIPRLKKLKGVDLIFALEKQFLDQASWEEGLKVMAKTGHWETFPEHVITANSLKKLPSDLGKALKIHVEQHDREPFDMICDNCKYRAVAVPLIEAGGTEVGDMFILTELSATFSGQKIFFFFAIIATGIVVLFYLIFSIYLGNIENNLNKNQQRLEEEIRNHLATEKELEEHQTQLDELIKRRTNELEKTMAEVKVLSGFLPICASCKNIRTEKGEWEQIESYIRDHSEVEFSHSYCPDCAKKIYRDYSQK